MESLVVLAIILAFKIPILGACWYLYRIIHDVPQPEIESDGGEFVRAEFDQGPRRRGPHGGPPTPIAAARRVDSGHDSKPQSKPAGDRTQAR